MSRLTFARSAGAAGPKMTDVRYIYRQTGGALNSQGGAHSRSPQLCIETRRKIFDQAKFNYVQTKFSMFGHNDRTMCKGYIWLCWCRLPFCGTRCPGSPGEPAPGLPGGRPGRGRPSPRPASVVVWRLGCGTAWGLLMGRC